jgi:hypothetical protein
MSIQDYQLKQIEQQTKKLQAKQQLQQDINNPKSTNTQQKNKTTNKPADTTIVRKSTPNYYDHRKTPSTVPMGKATSNKQIAQVYIENQNQKSAEALHKALTDDTSTDKENVKNLVDKFTLVHANSTSTIKKSVDLEDASTRSGIITLMNLLAQKSYTPVEQSTLGKLKNIYMDNIPKPKSTTKESSTSKDTTDIILTEQGRETVDDIHEKKTDIPYVIEDTKEDKDPKKSDDLKEPSNPLNTRPSYSSVLASNPNKWFRVNDIIPSKSTKNKPHNRGIDTRSSKPQEWGRPNTIITDNTFTLGEGTSFEDCTNILNYVYFLANIYSKVIDKLADTYFQGGDIRKHDGTYLANAILPLSNKRDNSIYGTIIKDVLFQWEGHRVWCSIPGSNPPLQIIFNSEIDPVTGIVRYLSLDIAYTLNNYIPSIHHQACYPTPCTAMITYDDVASAYLFEITNGTYPHIDYNIMIKLKTILTTVALSLFKNASNTRVYQNILALPIVDVPQLWKLENNINLSQSVLVIASIYTQCLIPAIENTYVFRSPEVMRIYKGWRDMRSSEGRLIPIAKTKVEAVLLDTYTPAISGKFLQKPLTTTDQMVLFVDIYKTFKKKFDNVITLMMDVDIPNSPEETKKDYWHLRLRLFIIFMMLYLMGFTSLFFMFSPINKFIPISFGLTTDPTRSSKTPLWILCANNNKETDKLRHPIMDYLIIIAVITQMIEELTTIFLAKTVPNSIHIPAPNNPFPVISYDIIPGYKYPKYEDELAELTTFNRNFENNTPPTYLQYPGLKPKLDMFCKIWTQKQKFIQRFGLLHEDKYTRNIFVEMNLFFGSYPIDKIMDQIIAKYKWNFDTIPKVSPTAPSSEKILLPSDEKKPPIGGYKSKRRHTYKRRQTISKKTRRRSRVLL